MGIEGAEGVLDRVTRGTSMTIGRTTIGVLPVDFVMPSQPDPDLKVGEKCLAMSTGNMYKFILFLIFLVPNLFFFSPSCVEEE